MTQLLLVIGLALLASWLLGRRLYKMIFTKEKPGCAKCASNPAQS